MKAVTWIVAKDLTSEIRALRAWPAMLLLGLVVALSLVMQVDVAVDQNVHIVGGLFWLGVFFAGNVALDRTLTVEREEGCWRVLLLYPVSPTILFLAKCTLGLLALFALECVLLPTFVVFADAPFFDRPLALGLVLTLGNICCASSGILVSAVCHIALRQGSLLAVLLLPLISPALWGATEATRLMLLGEIDNQWWNWIQFLGCFAVLFLTFGMFAFGILIED